MIYYVVLVVQRRRHTLISAATEMTSWPLGTVFYRKRNAKIIGHGFSRRLLAWSSCSDVLGLIEWMTYILLRLVIFQRSVFVCQFVTLSVTCPCPAQTVELIRSCLGIQGTLYSIIRGYWSPTEKMLPFVPYIRLFWLIRLMAPHSMGRSLNCFSHCCP